MPVSRGPGPTRTAARPRPIGPLYRPLAPPIRPSHLRPWTGPAAGASIAL